jgi:hypothetical protein
MSLVFLVAFLWLSMRTVLLLTRVQRHTPEAQLGRAFQEELNNRGLTLGAADADRLAP